MATIMFGLFMVTFLYGFIVPIVGYITEIRLGRDPALTQGYTSALLFIEGFVAVACAPIIAHFADKTSNRRTPLLLAIAGSAAGTALFAAAPSEAASSSAAWIVCFATLADCTDREHVGRTMGTAMSFVSAGIVTGPVVSGVILQLMGYWVAWSVPLVLLAINFVARLLLPGNTALVVHESEGVSHETDPLLAPEALEASNARLGSEEPVAAAPFAFYRIILCKWRVLAGLANSLMVSSIFSGFEATLPTHLRSTFGWNSLQIGLIFLSLQLPGILTGPLVGSLRDRLGLRFPTVLGWALLAPLLFAVGVPGSHKSPWADSQIAEQIVFISAFTGIGLFAPLVRGVGTLQLIIIADELKDSHPSVFGVHGSNSKMYAITEVAFNVGMMLGPLIGGVLSETLGFSNMCCALAILAVLVGIAGYGSLLIESPRSADEAHASAEVSNDNSVSRSNTNLHPDGPSNARCEERTHESDIPPTLRYGTNHLTQNHAELHKGEYTA
ncbi:related to vesicular amine transporter [Ramularia collo-cygni]|uniref:Related to vesicular amine transporter n=1 Tax=Ramularia collo-cygni TaxID=112498 RepID=A0A2D3VD21_9PEZI|nr:related to vesicular amine transporter [Ramularia collo-cygni]CZT18433.1 related to vesicular amine transporter [Ramularia collo-cygni]